MLELVGCNANYQRIYDFAAVPASVVNVDLMMQTAARVVAHSLRLQAFDLAPYFRSLVDIRGAQTS